MHTLGLVVLLAVASASVSAAVVPSSSSTSQDSLWRGTAMDGVVRQLEAACNDNNDGISCIKYKVLNLIDQALVKDSLQVSEGVSLVKNTDKPESAANAAGEEVEGETAKSSEGRGLLDTLESYVQSHDMLVRLPRALGGQTLAVSARNIDDNEISLALRDNPESDAQVQERSRKRRKNKLKKILVPILVFVLLKAMTLIPLAIGVLGLKAWNALQLSFFSFLISISLAMFQLFKKIASDAPPPAAAIHAAPWQDYSQYAAARTLLVNSQEKDADAQQLAYNAYSSQ